MIFIVILLFICASCSQLEFGGEQEYVAVVPIETKAFVNVDRATEYFISEDAACFYAEQLIDPAAEWSVKPFMSQGQPLFYILNSGETWKIISADMRTVPILAEGIGFLDVEKDGSFATRLMISELTDIILTVKRENPEISSDVVSLWKSYSSIADKKWMESKVLSNRVKTKSGADGCWVKVLISSNTSRVYYDNIPHLVSTKWSQDSPWNVKTPMIQTDHCKVGCVAVAVSQLMYYFNRLEGSPTGLYENVYLDFDHNYSSLWEQIKLEGWNSNSSRWSSMKKTLEESGDVSYSADLLTSVGRRLELNYGLERSTISDVTVQDLPQFGLSASYSETFDLGIVKSNLRDSIPVMIIGILSDGPGELSNDLHCFLIDGYVDYEDTATTTYAYYFEDDPASISSLYNGYNVESLYTEEEMQALIPNCMNGQRQVVRATFQDEYLLMNWGESNGLYDNNHYSTGGSSFWGMTSASGVQYGKKMYYNLSVN